MTRLDDILKLIQGGFVCVTDDQQHEFTSKDELTNSDLYKNYIVISIRSENNSIVLELQPWQPPTTDMDSDWVEEYKTLNGWDPSFF